VSDTKMPPQFNSDASYESFASLAAYLDVLAAAAAAAVPAKLLTPACLVIFISGQRYGGQS